MKTEDINEGNRLIAEFMGIESYESGGYTNFIYSDDNHRTHVDLGYHESWGWLMPVVEKIEGIEDADGEMYDVRIMGNDAEIVTFDGDVIIQMGVYDPKSSKIDAVWMTIVDFIKWYNQNK